MRPLVEGTHKQGMVWWNGQLFALYWTRCTFEVLNRQSVLVLAASNSNVPAVTGVKHAAEIQIWSIFSFQLLCDVPAVHWPTHWQKSPPSMTTDEYCRSNILSDKLVRRRMRSDAGRSSYPSGLTDYGLEIVFILIPSRSYGLLSSKRWIRGYPAPGHSNCM